IVREVMDIDFSKYGFPSLYIGAIVGYSWFDGQLDDDLEAPVYLLDEKQKEIEEMLERGEELPTYDDPRAVWERDIEIFSLRTIGEEYEKGYKDKETGEMEEIKHNEDIHFNSRLVNYSGRFGDVSNAVILEVVNGDYKEVYDNLSNIEQYKTELSKQTLEDMKKMIEKEGIKNVEDASDNFSLVDKAFYFGDHKWSVINWLVHESVEDVYESLADRIKEDGYEPIEYEKPVKEEGKDITKEFETIDEYIKKKKMRYNRKTDQVKLYMEYDDVEFFKHLDSMLVGIPSLELFKEEEKHHGMVLYYENGDSYSLRNYKLFRKFIPIVKEMMRRHIIGMDYNGIEDKIEEIGTGLLKESVANGTYEDDKFEMDDKRYKSNQTGKRRKKLKKYREKIASNG